VPDADVNLTAFQQRHLVHAESFSQLHVDVGEVPGISRQESRQDALDRLRRRGELKHARVSTLEQLDAFAERSDLTQYPAAIGEQLLASGGEEKAATDTVEKLEPAFVFEITDLPRQGRLACAQTHRRIRHCSEVGNRDERLEAFQVHLFISKMHKE
jgi:hypothetical protein